MPQGVVAVQPLEIRALDQLLEQSVRLVTSELLSRSLALALPSLIAERRSFHQLHGAKNIIQAVAWPYVN